jgi:hypothetical protein
MWRSYGLVMHGVRQRRPGLSPALIRKSRHQFSLYLAGVSFRSGAYRKSIGWASPVWRSNLALQILPSVVWLFLRTLLWRRRPSPRAIGPGVYFSDWKMPQPLIPYDRIYERRFKRLRGE